MNLPASINLSNYDRGGISTIYTIQETIARQLKMCSPRWFCCDPDKAAGITLFTPLLLFSRLTGNNF